MLYRNFFKPFLDFVISLVAFIIFSPLFILIAVMLSIVNRGSPFFVQLRPGKNQNGFRLIKFKTMNDRKDKNGNILPDSERLTPAGKLIRKTSLDEIPQLLNVIKGDMSLIGPRPLLVEYLPLYDDFQKRRHEVKPGITGWAQINGRNAISWKQKFVYDVWYVDNKSWWLDLKILFITLFVVISAKGVAYEDHTIGTEE